MECSHLSQRSDEHVVITFLDGAIIPSWGVCWMCFVVFLGFALRVCCECCTDLPAESVSVSVVECRSNECVME